MYGLRSCRLHLRIVLHVAQYGTTARKQSNSSLRKGQGKGAIKEIATVPEPWALNLNLSCNVAVNTILS